MRLLPALVVLLAAHSIYAWATGIPRHIEQPTVTSILFYYYNWRHTIVGPAEVGHLWSLSVEEQFYIVWPLALIALLAATRGRRRLVAAVVVVAIAAVVIGRASGWHHGTLWLWLYVQTNTRADSLLVGALLAIVGSHLATRSSRWLTPAAWLATGFLRVLCRLCSVRQGAPLPRGVHRGCGRHRHRHTRQPPRLHLARRASPAVGTVVHLGSGVVRPLSLASSDIHRHAEVRDGHSDCGTRAVLALAITALATYLSWVFVEQPFLRWKRRLDRRSQAGLFTADTGVAAVLPPATS